MTPEQRFHEELLAVVELQERIESAPSGADVAPLQEELQRLEASTTSYLLSAVEDPEGKLVRPLSWQDAEESFVPHKREGTEEWLAKILAKVEG